MPALTFLVAAKGLGAAVAALGLLALCAWALSLRKGAPVPAAGGRPAATVYAYETAAPAPAPEPAPEAATAAAIAVGLYLRGLAGAPGEEVAAAIAAALALDARGRDRGQGVPRESGWKSVGRAEGLRRWPAVRSRG